MNEALLVLAGALVKTAFKVWIKEPLLAENVTDDLIDLLRDRVVGTANQRKVRRWVEDLEGIVDQRLSAFFDHEFKNLTDNEREAAVLAVADTFAGARLSDRSLFEVDLDSLQLERFLRGSCPTATRDLGEAATGVYARLLPEACAYVISLATTLPDFHVGSFTELLRRETTIITKLDEVLARLPRQDVFDSESQAGADRGFAEFTTAYRRQIVARLDHLRLFGLDIFTRRYPLTLAYISMHVLNGRAPTRSNTSSRSIVDLSREADRTIEDVLANSQRLFLRGQAGSGKTTLLQWLAVRAASKDFPGGLRAWNDLEPFFIPLRRFVEKKLPVPSHFVDFVGKNIADNMPLGWVNRKLSEGSGLILIDGVDELPAVR